MLYDMCFYNLGFVRFVIMDLTKEQRDFILSLGLNEVTYQNSPPVSLGESRSPTYQIF